MHLAVECHPEFKLGGQNLIDAKKSGWQQEMRDMSCSDVKALETTISAFIGCTGSRVGHCGKSVQSATKQLSSDNRRSWRRTSTGLDPVFQYRRYV